MCVFRVVDSSAGNAARADLGSAGPSDGLAHSIPRQNAANRCVGAVGLVGGLASDGNVWAIGAGILVGGFVGNRIGKYLDDRDKEMLARSTSEAFSNGENQTFTNDDTGVSGEVIVESSEQMDDSGELTVLKDRVETIPPLELGLGRVAADW